MISTVKKKTNYLDAEKFKHIPIKIDDNLILFDVKFRIRYFVKHFEFFSNAFNFISQSSPIKWIDICVKKTIQKKDEKKLRKARGK